MKYAPKKKRKVHPEEIRILSELEELLHKLDIELKYERGNFKGGLCRIEEKQYFYLSKILSLEQKVNLIAGQLKSMNLENVYLKPKIRELLDT